MQFTIAADHPCLAGHFPGRPLVPGVVLLEQVLHAVEVHAGIEAGALRLPQVKFIAPLLPGRTARVALEGQAPRWKFSVSHQGQLLARGELVLAGDAGT